MRAGAIPIISVRGCGSNSGVGTWQKASIIVIGLVTTLLGMVLVYYGVKMWWALSGHQENALQYLSDRIGHSENQFDLIRADWEYEIVRMECAATRAPCESALVRRNRRSYRTSLAVGVFLVIFGIVGLCGASCENTTALSMFVIFGCILCLLEFGLMVVLFKSHHQMVTARGHASELMKQPNTPDHKAMHPVSLEQKKVFYKAMNWIDSMGNFDYSMVHSHFTNIAGSPYMSYVSFLEDSVSDIIFNRDPQEDRSSDPNDHRICPESYVVKLKKRSVPGTKITDDEEVRNPAVRLKKRSVIGDMMANAEGLYMNSKRKYYIEKKWLKIVRKFDKIWNKLNMSLNERTYKVAMEQNCMYTINKRIMYLLSPMDEMAYPVLVCGLISCLGFILHALGSPVAHLLVRALRNHYEDMIKRQREIRSTGQTAGVTVVNSTTSATSSSQQQQQQQQMMPMQPMAANYMPAVQTMGGYTSSAPGYVPTHSYYPQSQQQQQLPAGYGPGYIQQQRGGMPMTYTQSEPHFGQPRMQQCSQQFPQHLSQQQSFHQPPAQSYQQQQNFHQPAPQSCQDQQPHSEHQRHHQQRPPTKPYQEHPQSIQEQPLQKKQPQSLLPMEKFGSSLRPLSVSELRSTTDQVDQALSHIDQQQTKNPTGKRGFLNENYAPDEDDAIEMKRFATPVGESKILGDDKVRQAEIQCSPKNTDNHVFNSNTNPFCKVMDQEPSKYPPSTDDNNNNNIKENDKTILRASKVEEKTDEEEPHFTTEEI